MALISIFLALSQAAVYIARPNLRC